VLLVLSLAGVIAWLLVEHRRRLEDARREAVPVAVRALEAPAEARERVPEVLITVRVTPADVAAEILWDGVVKPATFSVPADGAPHRLEVRAEGYTTYGVDIPADGPHDVPVELVRARGRRR
jgi:hypothetical protein